MSPARILIVDDEPLNVDYLEQELHGLGYVTDTAADGKEALERIAAMAPDLVLLDVMMPGLDGITVLRLLKGDPETRLIPVVLLTALNAVDDRVRGIEAGADDFLTKPADERELAARIATALSLRRTIDGTLGELRSTRAHLARFGRRERDVAVLAVGWRPVDGMPEEATDFVVRAARVEAEEQVRVRGGLPADADGATLLAVFDGPDPRSRALAAVEAGLAVVCSGVGGDVTAAAAVDVGPALVGSTRVDRDGEPWAFTAEGEPVRRAAALARDVLAGGVLVTGDVGGLVSGHVALAAAGEGSFRVLGGDDAGGTEATPERTVRTLLVTDIVDSTPTVERIGDHAWAELVAAHERAVRAELVVHGGEEIDTAGDGFLATFESPARAIRCALAVRDRLAKLGLAIRAGVHSGEVEYVDGRARGIAVHLAGRIAASANPSEVMVSATTRELAAGAGLDFTDRGMHSLKGVAEPRRLYAAYEAPEPSGDAAEPRPRYPAGLTRREVDVLRLVAVGLSDAEAAERLFLSVRTVNAHLRSIYRKAGVRSRAAAGRFAEANGLLSGPPPE